MHRFGLFSRQTFLKHLILRNIHGKLLVLVPQNSLTASVTAAQKAPESQRFNFTPLPAELGGNQTIRFSICAELCEETIIRSRFTYEAQLQRDR